MTDEADNKPKKPEPRRPGGKTKRGPNKVSKRRTPNQAADAEGLCPTCERPFDGPVIGGCCDRDDCMPPAIRAKFPGMVLLATSEDPPELRRVEFSLDAIKPEYRLEVACGLSEMLRSLAKRMADEADNEAKKGSAK